MRRAARVDKNQPEIVEGLRKLGVAVQPLHAVGDGCPDILWGWRNVNGLIEIKDDRADHYHKTKNLSRCLTEAQHKFHFFWRGFIDVVWSLDEAIYVVHTRTGLDDR
jgi:hypothetical protein